MALASLAQTACRHLGRGGLSGAGVSVFEALVASSSVRRSGDALGAPGAASIRYGTQKTPDEPPAEEQQPAEEAPGGVTRLNHVAIAVPDVGVAAARYRDVYGASVSEPVDLPDHGVTTVFVELTNTKLELMQPLGQNSPIQGFLDRNPGGGLHHICLEVPDVKASIAQVSSHARVLWPEPRIGAHGTPVTFIHPKDNDGVLLELEQPSILDMSI